MRSKKEIEKDLQNIKGKVDEIRSDKMHQLLEEKSKDDTTSSHMLTILKMVIDQDKKNNMILKALFDKLEHLEAELAGEELYEQDDPTSFNSPIDGPSRVIPVSGLDAKILQIIQVKELACADHIMKEMGYKGRNAASARLNKLYRQGLLERHQLGHRVYYKFSESAGRTTNPLIVSPPQ
jgi:hypothetical protein